MAAEGEVAFGRDESTSQRWLAAQGLLGDGLDRLMAMTIAGCVALTVAVVAAGIHGHEIMPGIDLFVDTVAMTVSGALTALAWSRFRERHVVVAAYQSAAFLALATSYVIAVATSLEESTSVGSFNEPRDAQILVFAVAQLAAAVLFVASVTRPGARANLPHPVALLISGPVAVVAALVVATLLGTALNALQVIDPLEVTGLPTIRPLGAGVHLVTAMLFFVAAYGCRAVWRRDRAIIDAWIAVGLLFVGFAELNLIPFPRAHPGQVSVGDLLLLAGWLAFLVGLLMAIRSGLAELRSTNLELRELRDAEVERASLEERARLARELHDGLAQDLWLAKLRTGELVAMTDLPREARRVAEEALSAVDAGLGDAREAVATLRSSAHEDSGFCSLMRRHVEDYGDRFGLRAEFAFAGDHTTSIAPRTQAEILRVVQEALTNVAKHADATVVGVRLRVESSRVTLRVVDNGRGFDPTAPRPGTYGIATMRERASGIGGRLRIASRIDAGTLVVLMAPFAPLAETVEAGT